MLVEKAKTSVFGQSGGSEAGAPAVVSRSRRRFVSQVFRRAAPCERNRESIAALACFEAKHANVRCPRRARGRPATAGGIKDWRILGKRSGAVLCVVHGKGMKCVEWRLEYPDALCIGPTPDDTIRCIAYRNHEGEASR